MSKAPSGRGQHRHQAEEAGGMRGPAHPPQNGPQVRRQNRLRILRLVRRGPIARSELAVETGLTRAGISVLAGGLIQEGLLVEKGRRGSAGGRRPVLLELRPEYGFALGLTIGRGGAEAGAVNVKGELVTQTSLGALPETRGAALLKVKESLRRILRSRKVAGSQCLGLGISTPGPVDVMTGTILNPPHFSVWQDVRICDELRDVAGGRAFLANNSQALTMAERAYGRGRDGNSFLLMVVEQGVGSGLVRGDEVYAGWRGFGNEVGHTSIDCNGPLCECGLRGCLELYASVPNVLRTVNASRPGVRTWKDLVDLAHEGDVPCRSALEQQAYALAVAVVNVINTLELDEVVLTGEILYRGELLRQTIERQVNQSAMNRRLRHIPVYLSELDNHSAVMAAAGIAIEKFFQGETAAQG